MVVTSHEIAHRNEFALLCNWRKLYRALEIGVDKADFAVEFLSTWMGHNYMGVDPYLPYPEMPWDRSFDYLFAADRLKQFPARQNVKLVRQTSDELHAALVGYDSGYFAGLRTIDFIYIDAAHDYESVKHDIELWWPMVSDHGILAGHDFDDYHSGVVRAVTEFADTHKKTAFVTQDSPASWYIYRGEVPGNGWKRIAS